MANRSKAKDHETETETETPAAGASDAQAPAAAASGAATFSLGALPDVRFRRTPGTGDKHGCPVIYTLHVHAGGKLGKDSYGTITKTAGGMQTATSASDPTQTFHYRSRQGLEILVANAIAAGTWTAVAAPNGGKKAGRPYRLRTVKESSPAAWTVVSKRGNVTIGTITVAGDGLTAERAHDGATFKRDDSKRHAIVATMIEGMDLGTLNSAPEPTDREAALLQAADLSAQIRSLSLQLATVLAGLAPTIEAPEASDASDNGDDDSDDKASDAS